ncbi:hypothetical protein F4781DRAFT_412965 [Annulohypoxylon bovei var. microspora]|nr:hypothetical protein F4781DRAFT_412965 [Annulohypoxylon bovei var. microspora]
MSNFKNLFSSIVTQTFKTMSLLDNINDSSSSHDNTTSPETQDQERHGFDAVEEPFIDCVLPGREIYGCQQCPQKSKRGIQGCDNSLVFSVSRGSFVRTNRLVLNATRLLFGIAVLLNNTGIWYSSKFMVDIITTGCFVLWDLLEITGGSTYITVSASLMVREIFMSLGVLVIILFEIIDDVVEEKSWGDQNTPIVFLWFPVLILSWILVYYMVTGYLRAQHRQDQRPIIIYTETGDPVAVIPKLRSSYQSASRLSVDSLIQEPE